MAALVYSVNPLMFQCIQHLIFDVGFVFYNLIDIVAS